MLKKLRRLSTGSKPVKQIIDIRIRTLVFDPLKNTSPSENGEDVLGQQVLFPNDQIAIGFERERKHVCSHARTITTDPPRDISFGDELLSLPVTFYKESSGIIMEKLGNLCVYKLNKVKTEPKLLLGKATLNLETYYDETCSSTHEISVPVDKNGKPVGLLLDIVISAREGDASGDDEGSVSSFDDAASIAHSAVTGPVKITRPTAGAQTTAINAAVATASGLTATNSSSSATGTAPTTSSASSVEAVKPSRQTSVPKEQGQPAPKPADKPLQTSAPSAASASTETTTAIPATGTPAVASTQPIERSSTKTEKDKQEMMKQIFALRAECKEKQLACSDALAKNKELTATIKELSASLVLNSEANEKLNLEINELKQEAMKLNYTFTPKSGDSGSLLLIKSLVEQLQTQQKSGYPKAVLDLLLRKQDQIMELESQLNIFRENQMGHSIGVASMGSLASVGSISWEPDSKHAFCMQCSTAFTFLIRRHHCRLCGGVFCNECSKNRIGAPLVRACNKCSAK